MRGMVRKRLRFSDELRRAVDACGLSRYRICRELGIAESTLSRFMSGERGLTMKCLDRLAALLDLHVAAGKRPKKKG
jgi:transcriptional regulator with XRE-family HTH domain